MPDQESWGVNIVLTDQGMIRAKIRSGHLEKYNEKEFIMLDSSVTVDFFDSNEKHTSILTSNRAEVDQSSNDMKAIGNVVAVSDSGISLYSNTLVWDSKNEKLRTKDKIMITTLEKDTLYGIGFESDSDLENWKIINPSGVTGREFE
jgi:LPS export ABC transporter protein LptC